MARTSDEIASPDAPSGDAAETAISWHRVLWIAAFTFLIFNTGWCDYARPLSNCNPLTFKGCFDD